MGGTFSLRVVLMIAAIIVTQVAGASLLVKTNGFRDPAWTALCLGIYAGSLFLIAETIRRGMALSLIMPIMAALVPLATIAIAVLVFHEQASWLRLGLLGVACALVGFAATV